MKIIVIGGTGKLGSKIVQRLEDDGHEAVPAAPNTGVDTITGEGLAEVLEGAEVVVDVSNSPNWDDDAVLDFFRTSTGNIIEAEASTGVKHHVLVSIVGADRLPDSGYMRAKVAQERIVKDGPVPYTIVRSTQFFDFIRPLVDSATEGEMVRLPIALFQPGSVDDLAGVVAEVATGSSKNETVEVAGPRKARMDELAGHFLYMTHDKREVIGDPHARYFGTELDDSSLTPGDGARITTTRFDDWLAESLAATTERS